MDESTLTYIIAPLVSASIGGAAWLVKHYFEKKDEEDKQRREQEKQEQERVFAERNVQRERIEKRIDNLTEEVKETRQEVNELVGMIAGCENPNCPNRPRLRAKLARREGAAYGDND